MIDLHQGVLEEFAEHCRQSHDKELSMLSALAERNKKQKQADKERYLSTLILTESKESRLWKKTCKKAQPNNPIWKATKCA